MSVPNKLAAEKVAWLVYSHPEITKPGDIVVAMTIASFANDRGEAWPSNATISERAHVGHTFVSEAIERLKACEVLDWIDRSAKGKGGSNLYTIHTLVGIADQTPSAKRIGSKTLSNGYVPTETAEQRVRRKNRERNERRHQEREAEDHKKAVDPAESEQFKAELTQQARASGRLEG